MPKTNILILSSSLIDFILRASWLHCKISTASNVKDPRGGQYGVAKWPTEKSTKGQHTEG